MKETHERLAQSLAEAWRTCGTIPLPPADTAPATREDAFAIQDRMAELVARPLRGLEGRRRGPRRADSGRARRPDHRAPARVADLCEPGAGSGGDVRRLQDRMRVRVPFPAGRSGARPRRTRAPSSCRCSSSIRGSSSPARATPPEPADASSRPAMRSPTTATGGGYVVAEGIEDWHGIDFERMPIDARIDDGDPIEVYTGELRRDPVDILVETVNGLAERGIGLAAGDLLSTGSLTLPTPLRKGQTYVARFARRRAGSARPWKPSATGDCASNETRLRLGDGGRRAGRRHRSRAPARRAPRRPFRTRRRRLLAACRRQSRHGRRTGCCPRPRLSRFRRDGGRRGAPIRRHRMREHRHPEQHACGRPASRSFATASTSSATSR